VIARAVAVVGVAAAACGGSHRQTSAPVHDTGKMEPRPAVATVDADAICDRIAELGRDGCGEFATYGLDHGECVADIDRSLDERGEDARAATQAYGRCLQLVECNAVLACVEQMAGPDAGFRDCSDTMSSAAVGRPERDWQNRRGANARHYSDVPTTKDTPVEVCTIPAEMDWLMAVTCDDGTQPFANRDHAHASRVGNVGPGGSCGAIIDLYEVPCPEQTYSIYIDAYVCPLPDPSA
jgi:hypothetical protein